MIVGHHPVRNYRAEHASSDTLRDETKPGRMTRSARCRTPHDHDLAGGGRVGWIDDGPVPGAWPAIDGVGATVSPGGDDIAAWTRADDVGAATTADPIAASAAGESDAAMRMSRAFGSRVTLASERHSSGWQSGGTWLPVHTLG
jgi:hypothetical protein